MSQPQPAEKPKKARRTRRNFAAILTGAAEYCRVSIEVLESIQATAEGARIAGKIEAFKAVLARLEQS